MGKRRKRLTMAKYAKKYAKKRAALGFDTRKVESSMITIDMTTGEEVSEEETVQVVSNTPTVDEKQTQTTTVPEPQLQTVQVEEPAQRLPNALTTISEPEPEATPAPKTRTRRKRTTTTKKTTTRRKTTARKKTTKKAEE